MADLGILGALNNCEVLAKKIKLETCQSTSYRLDTVVKCTDILKALSIENSNEETNENNHPKSPTFPSRTRLRAVLQNRSNVTSAKVNVSKVSSKCVNEKKPAAKDAKDPGNVTDLISKVPGIEKQFTVKKRIGWGTFSTVFLATANQSDIEGAEQYYALKHICSESSTTRRVIFETKCLKEIGGCDNVAGLKCVLRSGLEHVLVMPYYKQDRFSTLIQEMSFEEVREYMRNLLIALRRVHRFNVIHRDVKPNNFLYDMKNKSGTLVDFGLAHRAHFFKPTHKKHLSCQTPRVPLKAPNDVGRTKPVKQIKKLSTMNGRCSPLQTRSSSMVAMAKSLHQASRKRCAEDVSTPTRTKDEKEGMPGAKRPCLQASESQQNRFTSNNYSGTPRPKFRNRHGFKPRGVPIYVPLPSTPSPLGNSTGSERIFTSQSPMNCQSSINQLSATRRTIGDLLPGIRKHKCCKTGNNGLKKVENEIMGRGNCHVSGKPTCSLNRSTLPAPRAGTSGFRAPEVLIQCPHQTTAVDIWSAGVIFLSLLTGRYPFFKPTNDMESLVQMIALFGTENVKEVAKRCGKRLTASYFSSGQKLQSVVEKFRQASESKKTEFVKPKNIHLQSPVCSPSSTSTSAKNNKEGSSAKLLCPPYNVDIIPTSAYDLLNGLLDVNPLTRLSAKEALEHAFFKTDSKQDRDDSCKMNNIYVTKKNKKQEC